MSLTRNRSCISAVQAWVHVTFSYFTISPLNGGLYIGYSVSPLVVTCGLQLSPKISFTLLLQ